MSIANETQLRIGRWGLVKLTGPGETAPHPVWVDAREIVMVTPFGQYTQIRIRGGWFVVVTESMDEVMEAISDVQEQPTGNSRDAG